MNNGAILVDSEPGDGTTLPVLLPIVSVSKEQQFTSSYNAIKTTYACGTILIIDNEEMVRDVSSAMLELLGFKTIIAPDGEEGLRIFNKQYNNIDLVLLDKSMRKMDGIEVFKDLRKIRSDIKILLASGYSKQDVSKSFWDLGLNGFIQKPFNLDHLFVALQQVLV